MGVVSLSVPWEACTLPYPQARPEEERIRGQLSAHILAGSPRCGHPLQTDLPNCLPCVFQYNVQTPLPKKLEEEQHEYQAAVAGARPAPLHRSTVCSWLAGWGARGGKA